MTTIPKNRTRTIADLKERLTECTRYDSDNQYQGKPTDPKYAWDKLPGKRVKLTANTDASACTVHVHENLWYELREPEPEPERRPDTFHDPYAGHGPRRFDGLAAPGEGAVGDVTFTFPGGTKVTVDPDGTVLDGPDTPTPPEPTDASIRAVGEAAGAYSAADAADMVYTPPPGSMSRALIAEALKRGWLRGWQDAQRAQAADLAVLLDATRHCDLSADMDAVRARLETRLHPGRA